MIFNKGGFLSTTPSFTYTGEYRYVKDENGWQLDFLTSGVLSLKRTLRSIDLFVLGGGGAGANTGGRAYGGGGYYQTVNGIRIAKGVEYSIVVGSAGASSGENGGSSSAFGHSAQGGKAATSGKAIYANCTVYSSSGTAGNLYYYETLSSDAQSMGQGYHDVKLEYPLQQVKHNNGATVYVGYPSGYYRCLVQSTNSVEYASGTNGAGAAETRVFENGEAVSGLGNDSGVVRRGQGGGAINIAGGKGLVCMRYVRSQQPINNTAVLDHAMLDQMTLD